MIKKIKIAYHQLADKPIYLLSTGVLVCGNFKYTGRYKDKFKSFFVKICDLVNDKHRVDEYDVSDYKYWNAINIYHDYILPHWCTSIKVEQIEKFANETEIVIMIEEIRSEFIRAVHLKWKRIFKKSDPNDPRTTTKVWQIL